MGGSAGKSAMVEADDSVTEIPLGTNLHRNNFFESKEMTELHSGK
jgi:hypothetical protein